jgi:outer membrane autotransporter protein
VTFAQDSRLEVDASDAATDLLVVQGAADLGASSELRIALGSVDRNALFTRPILDAGQPVAGTLFQIDQQFAFFTAAAILDPGDATRVLLQLEPNDNRLPDFAETENQAAVGAALETAFGPPPLDPDLANVESALGGLSVEAISEALGQMAGESLTEFATTRLAVSDRFHTSAQERIRGLAWGDGETLLAQQTRDAGAPVLAANPILAHALPGLAQGGAWPAAVGAQPSLSSVLDSATSFQPAQGEHGLGGWIDGYGLFGELSEGDSADLDYTVGGVSLGLDYLIAHRWLVGVAGGYARSDLDFDGLPGDANADTGQGALYAGYVVPWLQLGASLHYGYSAMSVSRDIDFMGRTADADFDGWDLGARAEAALDLWKLGPVELQPLASFAYTHVQQDEIDESGADSLDLTTDELEVDSAVSGLGARIHGVLAMDEELWFHPELRARWLHEFGDTERELDARIGGVPGVAYVVRGAEVPADTGVFGVSWTVVAMGRLHAFADYDVTLGSGLFQQGVALGLKLVW